MGLLSVAMRIRHMVTPSAPAAGSSAIYFKSDGLPYFMGPDGVEKPFVSVSIPMHLNPGLDQWASGKPSNWNTYWRDTASPPATWLQDTTTKVAGTNSMKITSSTGSNGRLLTSIFSTQPGDLVSFSVWAKGTGSQPRLGLSLMSKKDADPSFFDPNSIQQSSTIVLTDEWRKYLVSWRVPSDHNRVNIDVNPYSASGGVSDIWIDETDSSVETTSSGAGVETGSGAIWFTDTPPPGYVIADGGTELISVYPVLGALWGTKYGGNGTTTFGKPNLAQRVPVGKSPSGAESAVGYTGGSNDTVLSAANIPAHVHTINHTHSTTSSNDQAVKSSGSFARASNTVGTTNNTSLVDTHTGNSGTTCSGTAFDTRDKYMIVNYIIKT